MMKVCTAVFERHLRRRNCPAAGGVPALNAAGREAAAAPVVVSQARGVERQNGAEMGGWNSCPLLRIPLRAAMLF